MKVLEGLGWQWRENGVVVCVQVSGQKLEVFVPLNRVWHAFNKELTAVGCPFEATVGSNITVSGLFSGIAHAVSHAASSVAHAATGAVKKAAGAVENVAKKYGAAALKDVKSVATNKYFRGALVAASFAVPALAPAAAAVELANKAYSTYQQGLAAAHAIQQGINTVENVAKVAQGLDVKNALATVIQRAQSGDQNAQQLVGAFQQRMRSLVPTTPAPAAVAPRAPAMTAAPMYRWGWPRIGAPMVSFTPRYKSRAPAVGAWPFRADGRIHHHHHQGQRVQAPTWAVTPQQPYQTPTRQYYAYAR